jgi:hypothetical protein
MSKDERMNAPLIQAKINALTKDFEESLGVPLWSQFPLAPFGDIARPVGDDDSLKARLASLSALFEYFNKKSFDAALGNRTTGTRSSFVAFLKRRFPDDQVEIENAIEAPMGLVCLLRDYLLHTKNRNYRKALDYFQLSDPIDAPALAWDQILTTFAEWLDRVRSLTSDARRDRYSNEVLTADPLNFLVKLVYARNRDTLEETPARAMLNEIIRRGSVNDIELASTFGISVENLRKLLYPIIGDILIVKPVDRYTTQLSVSTPMVEVIKNGPKDSANED